MTRLEKIRKDIVRSSDLLENGKPKLLDEEVLEEVNCYWYALGIIREQDEFKSNPGFTEEYKYYFEYPGKNIFLGLIEKDLKNLNLKYRIFGLNSTIELKENEYLIKVLICYEDDYDFHFVRQDPKTKLWFEKDGFYNQPELSQPNPKNGKIGNEPELLKQGNDIYKPVFYIAITEN